MSSVQVPAVDLCPGGTHTAVTSSLPLHLRCCVLSVCGTHGPSECSGSPLCASRCSKCLDRYVYPSYSGHHLKQPYRNISTLLASSLKCSNLSVQTSMCQQHAVEPLCTVTARECMTCLMPLSCCTICTCCLQVNQLLLSLLSPATLCLREQVKWSSTWQPMGPLQSTTQWWWIQWMGAPQVSEMILWTLVNRLIAGGQLW